MFAYMVEPLNDTIDGLLDLLLVRSVDFAGNLVVLDGVPHVVGVVLKSVLVLDL